MVRILILSIYFTTLAFCCHAQNHLTLDEKREMVQNSSSIELDDKLVQKIKAYALDNNFQFAILQKNTPHLQVIFNEQLSKSKRVQYCNYLKELWENDHSILPIGIILKQRKELTNKKSK